MYRVFTRPIPGDDTAERELNAFLATHRIVSVQSCLAPGANGVSQWVWCVEYTGEARADGGALGGMGRGASIDYAQELPPDVFALFNALREMRKTLATNEGVKPFVVFTNAQLAEIARRRSESLAALRKVEGVGEARAEKYGAAVLDVLARRPDEPEKPPKKEDDTP